MNAWQKLGLSVCLDLSEEKVEESFRRVSEGAHPDAGGELGRFEEIREARDLLRDDFLRLEAWLELQGVELTHSGVISPEVGEMFVRVNEVTQGVDDWFAARVTKSSGLGRALSQKEGLEWKAQVEELIGVVAEWQEKAVMAFVSLEEDLVVSNALKVRDELGFLRKWHALLQGCFGRIWEGLI